MHHATSPIKEENFMKMHSLPKKLMEIKMLVCICKKENVKLNVAVNVSSNFVLKVVIKDHPMQCMFLKGWSLISNYFPR